MTDEQRVKEAYFEALEESMRFPQERDAADWVRQQQQRFFLALADRLQPKPEPPKKVWSVSRDTVRRYVETSMRWIMAPEGGDRVGLNAVAADIIRERPDLVAEEWERRCREAAVRGGYAPNERTLTGLRRNLFPELDPK